MLYALNYTDELEDEDAIADAVTVAWPQFFSADLPQAGSMSASWAWQLSWLVGAVFCVLASMWFLVLTVPDEGLPLGWVLAFAFGLVCIAAAASLRRLLWEAFMSPGPVSYSSGAASDEPMGVHKRGPHGGLRTSGFREGGAGLGGVVRSLFRGFGLLLLEGVVRTATTAIVFDQGGCSFGHGLTK